MLRNKDSNRRIFYLSAFASFLLIGLYFSLQSDSHPWPSLRLKIEDRQWNPARDSENLSLDTAQCYRAFPGLFKAADDALLKRRNNPITPEELGAHRDVENYFRGMVVDNEIYVVDVNPGPALSRGISTLMEIYRAVITSPEPLPNVEFAFSTKDLPPDGAAFGYTKRRNDEDSKLWLIPDFGTWAWSETKVGSYYQVRRLAATVDNPAGPNHVSWDDKKSKILWRGRLAGQWREDMYDASRDYDWSDIDGIDWGNSTDVKLKRLAMSDHCKWKYLAHVDGGTYSGRLKYLQNCESVIFMPDLEWIQYWYQFFESSGPNQNIVKVQPDWSDLPEKMDELMADDELARRIAKNSVQTFRDRYLTPAAEACYWRVLLQRWREASFEPEIYEIRNGSSEIRGVSLESFIWQRRLEWDAH